MRRHDLPGTALRLRNPPLAVPVGHVLAVERVEVPPGLRVPGGPARAVQDTRVLAPEHLFEGHPLPTLSLNPLMDLPGPSLGLAPLARVPGVASSASSAEE